MSSVKFNPSGLLDCATDPSDLPFDMSGKTAVSEALTRCTNLHQDRAGVVSTRWGSAAVGNAAVATPVHRIIEQNGDRYVFGGTHIYKNESSIGSGYTSAKWSAIKYNAYNVTTQSIFALNGTDRKRITGTTVAEWGIEAPVDAPTLTSDFSNMFQLAVTQTWEDDYSAYPYYFGQSYLTTYRYLYDWEEDELAGTQDYQSDSVTYRYMWWFEGTSDYTSQKIGVQYTYVRKSGDTVECESNPSPESYIDAIGPILVYWPVPTDTQITHIRLYRTLPDGTEFYYSEEHDIVLGPGNANTATLTKQDTQLGAEVESDHDRPPLGSVVVGPDFNGTCFIIKDNLLYFSKPQQPEYWPALYYLEVSAPQEELIGVILYSGQAYALTQSDIYLIQGTGHQSFFPIRQTAMTGALGQDGILALRGKGILRVANDGLWGFTGSADENLTNAKFRPIFFGSTIGSIPGINRTYTSNSWVISWRNKLYHGFPGGTEEYPGQILVTDLATGKTQHYDYGIDISTVVVDVTNGRILVGDSNGYIRKIEDSNLTTDDGAAISWDYQSAEVSDQVRQYFPRSSKYDVEVGGTATAHVMLDGVSKQSHTLSGSRNSTKRLVATCTGKRLQCRITGTGAVSIWGAELE